MILPNGSHSVEEFVQPKKKGLFLGTRQVYLITYSQADFKVQTPKQFVEFICEDLNREYEVVERWMVSAELQRNKGIHYHFATKLKKTEEI